MTVNSLIDRWKAYKSTDALERYWKRMAPEGTDFSEADAVAMALLMLDCYEGALRRIAEKGGPDADVANGALAYKPPVWR